MLLLRILDYFTQRFLQSNEVFLVDSGLRSNLIARLRREVIKYKYLWFWRLFYSNLNPKNTVDSWRAFMILRVDEKWFQRAPHLIASAIKSSPVSHIEPRKILRAALPVNHPRVHLRERIIHQSLDRYLGGKEQHTQTHKHVRFAIYSRIQLHVKPLITQLISIYLITPLLSERIAASSSTRAPFKLSLPPPPTPPLHPFKRIDARKISFKRDSLLTAAPLSTRRAIFKWTLYATSLLLPTLCHPEFLKKNRWAKTKRRRG